MATKTSIFDVIPSSSYTNVVFVVAAFAGPVPALADPSDDDVNPDRYGFADGSRAVSLAAGLSKRFSRSNRCTVVILVIEGLDPLVARACS
ncbi:MAG: hypothetical protein LKG22_03300 [Sphingobium sp.]|jgi:hypothetical protein|nr:hypothetical protein [Sphingobium sp.]